MSLDKTLLKFGLIEGLVGELTRSFSFTDEPKFYHYHCTSRDKKIESASCDLDEKKAKIKALGEYLERICLDSPSCTFEKYSYSERTSCSLDPRKMINFRDEDLNFRKQEYLEKVVRANLLWIAGRDEIKGGKVYLPAQTIFVDYPFEEPIIRPRISTGAAAHEDRDLALMNGILENIERDSYMLTYFPRRSVPRISLQGDLKELENYFKRYNLELAVFETTTDLGIPSFICVNLDKTGIGPAVSVGLNAGLNPEEAIKGAIIESQQVRQWIRYKYIEDGRPQIDSPDKIKEVEHRGYFWYPLKRILDLDFLLKSSSRKEQSEIVSPPNVKNVSDLVGYLSEKGIDTYSVDITLKPYADAGFSVIRAVQPQLHPMFLLEGFPCLDSPRMSQYCKHQELNSVPHPFM